MSSRCQPGHGPDRRHELGPGGSDPTRSVSLHVTIRLPHAECSDRQTAIRRVAEHCPVHQSIASFSGLSFEIVDRTDVAASLGAVGSGP